MIRVCIIPRNSTAIYLDTCTRLGQRLGTIKPTPLHKSSNWRALFDKAARDETAQTIVR